MSIQPQPIYGNQYFTEVQNVASTNFQRIHADSLVCSRLQVGVNADITYAGGLEQKTVKGYVAVAAGSYLTAGSAKTLSKTLLPAATAVDASTAVVLPANAVVTRVVFKGVSLVGDTGSTVGLVLDAALNTAGTTAVTSTAFATVNAGVSPALVAAQVVATGSNRYISIQPATAELQTGSLVAYITYVIPSSA
jgi:hypothetical protein